MRLCLHENKAKVWPISAPRWFRMNEWMNVFSRMLPNSTPHFVRPSVCLSVCLSVRLSVRQSVSPFLCHTSLFLGFGSLWPHCSCPNDQVTSNTAAAHPHATGVAVYPALFMNEWMNEEWINAWMDEWLNENERYQEWRKTSKSSLLRDFNVNVMDRPTGQQTSMTSYRCARMQKKCTMSNSSYRNLPTGNGIWALGL